MAFEFVKPSLTELKPRIGVVGVGGAGGNAVSNMIAAGVEGVDFIVANTDAQALAKNEAATRIQLGLKITQGLGAGARPEIGAAAAEEAMDALEEAIEGYHMLFITAGMGGGTGTGAAPVVARAAREKGILTVGVVTKPFAFEGAKRMRSAEAGIAALQQHVDTLIVIPNQNLFLIANAQTSFKQAFAMADEVLNQGVRSITDLMILPGLINLDFADVRTVMSEMGKAMMGTGEASGERRAIEAAEKAISNPLLDEVSLRGAKAVIVNITGGDDLGLMEVEEAAQHIREMVDPDANIIVGSAFNNELDGKMRVSVVATGIETAVVTPPVANPASARAGGSLFGKPTAPSTPLWGAAAPAPAAPVATPAPAPEPEPIAEAEPEPVAEIEEPVLVAAPESVAVGVTDHAPTDEEVLDLDEPLDLTNEVVVATPEPEPAPERPLTLFERMMNLHRKPKAPEPAAEDSEANVPPFMRKQRNG